MRISPGSSFRCSATATGARRSTGRAAFLEENEDLYHDLHTVLELVRSHLQLLDHPPDEVGPLVRRTLELAEGMRFVMEGEDEEYVYWLERRNRGVYLQATPIDHQRGVGGAALQPGGDGGADLGHAGGLRQFRIRREKRLGCRHARTLVVPSHFDYQKQALLYVPQQLPDPRNQAFPKVAADEVVRLLELSRGARLRALHQCAADAPGA